MKGRLPLMDNFEVYGEAEGERILREFIEAYQAVSPRVIAQAFLQRYMETAQSCGYVGAQGILYAALARASGRSGDRERCAFAFNDLGLFLERAADLRCLACFRMALRLTKNRGRRIRTLIRLGKAHAQLRADRLSAMRCIGAAILEGWAQGEGSAEAVRAEACLIQLVQGGFPPHSPEAAVAAAARKLDLKGLV